MAPGGYVDPIPTSAELRERLRADIGELRETISNAYTIFGDALDAIQTIAEMPMTQGIEDESTKMVREGIEQIVNHSRNLLGLTRKG